MDSDLVQVMKDVARGRLSEQVKKTPYGKVYEELTVCGGALLKGDRVVIPPKLIQQVIELAHESHGLGQTKTIRHLRERVWFPNLSKKVKQHVEECVPCAVSVPRNDPAPIKNRPLPEGPWREVAVDYKGPIGGQSGFYYHVVIDLYSRYPEVVIVKDTSFDTLKPKLEEIWARFGIPGKIIHDGGPPYNSRDWRHYAKEIGTNLELCTPEHPQSNGTAEKMMANLVKITHAAIAEGKEPASALQSFLLSYRSTPHPSTGKSPSQLLMGKELNTKVPNVDSLRAGAGPNTVEGDKQVRDVDAKKKQKHKEYADRRRRARDSSVKAGDRVVVKQEKTTLRPPWDPQPYQVQQVHGTKVYLSRNGRQKIRNIEKCKVLKQPVVSSKPVAAVHSVDESEDDWDLDNRRRQDVGLAGVQAPVGVAQTDNMMLPGGEQQRLAGPQEDEDDDDWDLGYGRRQDVGLAAVQDPVTVTWPDDVEDVGLAGVQQPVGVAQAEKDVNPDNVEDVGLAAVQEPVAVAQAEEDVIPEVVQVFGFAIPEGMQVEPRRPQRVRRTPKKYANYDTTGGDTDESPVHEKKLSPRDRKRRRAVARHRAKGGPPILQEEEEGERT